ncbi:MAG: prephenate dehydrogenase/arogenate dehydrogenase family protein [Miltoncostaeaceae bacterium]
MPAPLRIGVVGAGLIGGSIIRAAVGAGAEVTACDRDAATVAALEEAGVRVVDGPAEVAAASAVAFAAVPPQAAPKVCLAMLDADAEVLVTDTASVKESVCRAVAADAGPAQLARFVAGHPLAGRESRGWENADPAILAGAVWALCPQPGATDPAALLRVMEVVTGPIGARVAVVDAHEHDVALACTSHMPHLAASALIGTVAASAPALRYRLSGGALRDGTRVAAASSELWDEILRDNAGNIVVALDTLVAELGSLRDLVAEGRWERLLDRWQERAALRDDLQGARWGREGTVGALGWGEDLGPLLAFGRRGGLVTAVHRTDSGGAVLDTKAVPAPTTPG